MGEPIQFTPQLVQEHPAFKDFYNFIRHNQKGPVDFAKFSIYNPRPNDGRIEIHYKDEYFRPGEKNPFIAAMLDANNKTLTLNKGWLQPNTLDPRVMDDEFYDKPILKVVKGSCHTLKALGGTAEAKFPCEIEKKEVSPEESHRQMLSLVGGKILGGWVANDIIFSAFSKAIGGKAFPMTRFFFGFHLPEAGQSAGFSLRIKQMAPGLLAGGAGMALFQGLGNLMDLDPTYHRRERFSLGVIGAYGGQHLAAKYWGGIRPNLGAGLLSAALVDATLGPLFGKEGSASREIAMGAAFFLPNIYRGLMGSRTLMFPKRVWSGTGKARVQTTIGQRRGVAGATRWLGRIAIAGFLADFGYMGYNYFSEGAEGSARSNRLYARAQELQTQNEGSSLWRGALGFIAPSLVRRYTTKGRYVDLARQEIEDQAKEISYNATSYLRHSLIQGEAGQNRKLEFYQKVNLDWLQGPNQLKVVTRADGTRLPVDSVSEQLRDPKIYQRQIQNGTTGEVLAYIQREFPAWPLTPGDVQEIFGRISLHQARSEIRVLKQIDPNAKDTLAPFFDEKGNLKDSAKSQLLQHIVKGLPGLQTEEHLEEQILALRKVGLIGRIRQLQEALKAAKHPIQGTPDPKKIQNLEKDLGAYQKLAVDLDLMNAEGDFIASEVTRFGLGLPIAELPTSPVRKQSKGETYLQIVNQYSDPQGV